MSCLINSVWELPECFDIIRVNAHLAPSTDVTYLIIGDTGRRYEIETTTDTEGAILIDPTKFPDGYFNSGRGFFTFMIADPLYCALMDFTICGVTVSQVVMRFVKSGTPVIQTQIG